MALVPAFAVVHEQRAELRLDVYGDGPEWPHVLRQIERFALGGVVSAPGFVDDEGPDVEHDVRPSVLCFLHAARGTDWSSWRLRPTALPSVVVAGPDNAAVELVEEGINGAIAASTEPGDLAAAIVRVHDLGAALHRSTTDWYDANAYRLSLEASLGEILRVYADG